MFPKKKDLFRGGELSGKLGISVGTVCAMCVDGSPQGVGEAEAWKSGRALR